MPRPGVRATGAKNHKKSSLPAENNLHRTHANSCLDIYGKRRFHGYLGRWLLGLRIPFGNHELVFRGTWKHRRGRGRIIVLVLQQ